MPERFVNKVPYLLQAACLATDTTLTLQSVSGLPLDGTFRFRMGSEIVAVTAVNAATNVITVTRGTEGTAAVGQPIGTQLMPILSAAGMVQLSYDLGAAGNPALLQTAWFINYATGLPTNDGKTAQTPVDRASTIRKRWGGLSIRPKLPGINIAIQIAGNAPDFSDPIGVLWDVDMAPGGTIVIDAVTTVKRSGTIASVPNAFARTSTGQQTITDSAVSQWTPDVDQLLIDTTSGAASWVVLGGASATLCAARAQSTNAAGQATSILNAGVAQTAISATHAYQILTLPTVYFGNHQDFHMGPGSAQGGSAGNGTATVLVRRFHGMSQNAVDVQICNATCEFPGSVNPTGALVMFVECIHEQAIRTSGGVIRVNGAGIVSTNGDEFDGNTGNSAALLAGYNRRNTFISGGAAVDQDFQILGSFIMQGVFSHGAVITVGNFGRFLMGGASQPFGYPFNTLVEITANYDAQAVVYGTRGANPIFKLSGNTQEGFGSAILCLVASATATFAVDSGAAADFTFETLQTGYASAANGVTYGPFFATVGNVDTYGGLRSLQGSRVAAIPATTPAVPLTWSQAGWFIDPQNAQGTSSDNNDGKTSGTSLRTYAGLLSKWGTTDPQHTATPTITFLSSHTNNADPIVYRPLLRSGTQPVLTSSGPALVSNVTLSGVTAKNRSLGSNSPLIATLSAATQVGMMVINTTSGKASRARVMRSLGGNSFELSQPLAPASLATPTAAPAEVDTWANTDTVQVVQPIAIHISRIEATVVDPNAGDNNTAIVYNVDVFDPAGVGFSTISIGPNVVWLEVGIQKFVGLQGNVGLFFQTLFINCLFQGGFVGFSANFYATGGGSLSGMTLQAGCIGQFDGDFVSEAVIQATAGCSLSLSMVYSGAGGITASTTAYVTFQTGNYGGHVLYGRAGSGLTMQGRAAANMATGTAVAGITAPGMVTGITMNGAATAQTHTNASPDVITSSVATTPTNWDAATGGVMANFGGCSLQKAA